MQAKRLPGVNGDCRAGSTVSGSCYRFTVLTSRLVRMEYAPDGAFENRPTQIVLNRDFEVPSFTVYETDTSLEIGTEHLNITYDKQEFSIYGLAVKVRSACCGIYSTWRFSEPVTEGLWGTARTLDQADGPIPLEPGLQSRIGGFGVLDDSGSLILLEDGWIEPRKSGVQDLYFFGYGFDYKACLRDFFHLCGKAPLLPRYALGNWWSRFYPYSAEEYTALMDRFTEEKIPLSVAVLDMDWHLREIDPKYGKGWTGYTWNRALFSDPSAFLTGLHARNLKTTLNLHPAEGIQPHEAMYAEMCRALDRDPALGQPIPFDFCDPDFIRAYFTHVIHPLEQEGADFWWIDWQQGCVSKIPNADPLWLQNHYFFLDHGKGANRPMIFSRYAGPGSHRYPIGFSGDSIISWDTLDFQPYFTANAANIGYGWWSHDIGGHAAGCKDEELMARWVQFGTFSPILRLHSTSNLFNGKEPWKYREPVRSVLNDFLRLRHRLVPYLYTMNWRCCQADELLVQPMYYRYPELSDAYEVPNQYEFGSELTVCPITRPMDRELGVGRVTAWLPERLYFDFFTGLRYHGGRRLNLYRPMEAMAVLAKAGAIVPLTGAEEALENGVALPKTLELRTFLGGNGHLDLCEDDGETMAYADGQRAVTPVDFRWCVGDRAVFTVGPATDPAGLLPPQRQYSIVFMGAADTAEPVVTLDGAPVTVSKEYDEMRSALTIKLPPCKPSGAVKLCFPKGLPLADNREQARIFALLSNAQISYELKEDIYRRISFSRGPDSTLCELQAQNLSPDLLGAISEILFAK